MNGVVVKLFSLVILVFVLVGSACSSDERAPYATQLDAVLPLSGDIAGWDEDTSLGENGIEIAIDVPTATGMINGAINSIDLIGTWNGVAMEYYEYAEDTEIKIKAFVIEMSTRKLGEKGYDELYEYNPDFSWSDMDFGGGEDQGRGGPDVKAWYADVQKGRYLLQFEVKPVGKAETSEAFITSVLQRIQ